MDEVGIGFDDFPEVSEGNTTSWKQDSSTQSGNWLTDMDIQGIQAMRQRTQVFAGIILLLGTCASSLFLWFGTTNANDRATDTFDARANDLILVVQTSWGEFERAAAGTHEVCRRQPATTRQGFREYYEYLEAGGLGVQAIQCAPNVTHDERPSYEAEAELYWEGLLPDYEYGGFTALIWDYDTQSIAGVETPATESPFYFPVHYLEPVAGNEGAIDLDLWSDPVEGAALIATAIETMQPILTGRLNTVQETVEGAYSVIIYHPGIVLSTTEPGERSDMIATLLVRIPSLLERVAILQEENLATYLYNVQGGDFTFLGAAEYRVESNETLIAYPAEIDYETLKAKYDSNRFYEEHIPIASGQWCICVVPIDDTYEPNLLLVIFGGAMILAASGGVAFWMLSNMRRVIQIYQAKAQAEAERTIVANLFPSTVRSRLLEGTEAKNAALKVKARAKRRRLSIGKSSEADMSDHMTSEGLFGSKPIADFHPEATLLFADLVGFTAWSSVREPTQVFTLLEVLYNAFDRIAKRRRIFKVETVGDCYVASCGAPEQQKDHALHMARYAVDCLNTVPLIVNQLERSLGPDTGDLGIRLGIHSGAVTSGVLRGDKGRFQLFGDTMNTASRMESTGEANRIQVSPDTAELLKLAGKGSWLEPRAVKVFVKGKGHLQTYWLNKDGAEGQSSHSSSAGTDTQISQTLKVPVKDNPYTAKLERLQGWTVEEMIHLVETIVARRQALSENLNMSRKKGATPPISVSGIPLDEVQDVVQLPEFDPRTYRKRPRPVRLAAPVVKQLSDLVSMIGALYQNNPFHNFEHASHVAMSVTKLLSRIVNPREVGVSEASFEAASFASELHDHTFGITSDPLTQFAAFFSALVHDVDHPGVPNTVLATENPEMAAKYRDTSIAEQNSIDIAWGLFMREEYSDLRNCVCATAKELRHFRQLIVQMVMSTDIMDKKLGQLRKERWNIAFADDDTEKASNRNDSSDLRNRKATIVIEHLIQASDVSHTMQHWHIYRKWNQKLFMELYHAYKQGRMETDPSIGWYKGELGFFDYYVVPLAKKLDTCGVFGVSSDEFLIYAMQNRQEWELKGEQLVQDYLKKYNNEGVNSSGVELYRTRSDLSDSSSRTMALSINMAGEFDERSDFLERV